MKHSQSLIGRSCASLWGYQGKHTCFGGRSFKDLFIPWSQARNSKFRSPAPALSAPGPSLPKPGRGTWLEEEVGFREVRWLRCAEPKRVHKSNWGHTPQVCPQRQPWDSEGNLKESTQGVCVNKPRCMPRRGCSFNQRDNPLASLPFLDSWVPRS